MLLCWLFQAEMLRRLSSPVPSPLRRTLCYVSCVRLSRDVHRFQFELIRICIAFSVAERIPWSRDEIHVLVFH